MRKTDAKRHLPVLVAVAGLLSGACGATQPTSTRPSAGIASPTEMRAFLEDARSAASAYGQENLGHFLQLNDKRLRRHGLFVPAGTTIEIDAGHDAYCIRASSSEIPASSRWANATASSGIEGVSHKDRCRD